MINENSSIASIDNQVNKFPINLAFKNPFNGKLSLTFRNAAKTEIRKYQLQITAHPKPVKAVLEFRVPARNQTTQDIPIINNTDRDWPIKVILQGDNSKNGNMFTCPSQYQKEVTNQPSHRHSRNG